MFFGCVWVLFVNCSFNMFMLVVMGMGVVWVYSVVVMVVFGIFLSMFWVVDGFVVIYFEVVFVIVVFVLLG